MMERDRARRCKGTCGTVCWELEPTGELHLRPRDGRDGTLAGNAGGRQDFWPWYPHRAYVTSVTSEGTIRGSQSMSGMFRDCPCLTDVSGLASWDVSHVTEMTGLFCRCTSLTDLSGLAGWDTSRVRRMSLMFCGCWSLEDLSPLADWDVSRVRNMRDMFYGCSSLSDVSPLAGWDVSGTRNTSGMFYGCRLLTDVREASEGTGPSIRKGDAR